MSFNVTPLVANQAALIRRQSVTVTDMAGSLSAFARKVASEEKVEPEAVLSSLFRAGHVFWSEQEHTPLKA